MYEVIAIGFGFDDDYFDVPSKQLWLSYLLFVYIQKYVSDQIQI